MNKKLNVLGIIALTMPLTALAGQVDSAKITAFTANTPAKAAEVNSNFAEQTKQINANSGVMDQNSADLKAIQAAGAGFGGHLLKPLRGLVSIGSQTVMLGGNGTKFSSDINKGDAIKVGEEVFTVVAVNSDTSLTLDTASLSGALDVQAFVDDNLLSVVDGNGVSQLTVDKSGNMDVQGGLSRRIAHVRGFNDVDPVGGIITPSSLLTRQLMSRVLAVSKKNAGTALRIGYTDNFRVTGGTAAATPRSCTWEIRVDGKSCLPGKAVYTLSTYHLSPAGLSYSADQFPNSVIAYCDGILTGEHEVQVWVGPTPGHADSECFTGLGTTWVLEAEEVY